MCKRPTRHASVDRQQPYRFVDDGRSCRSGDHHAPAPRDRVALTGLRKPFDRRDIDRSGGRDGHDHDVRVHVLDHDDRTHNHHCANDHHHDRAGNDHHDRDDDTGSQAGLPDNDDLDDNDAAPDEAALDRERIFLPGLRRAGVSGQRSASRTSRPAQYLDRFVSESRVCCWGPNTLISNNDQAVERDGQRGGAIEPIASTGSEDR